MPSHPPGLHRLQSWLRGAFTRQPDPGASDLASVIVDRRPMTRQRRIEVYAEAYYWRLVECLRADFAATHRAAGRQAFETWVARFLETRPSRTFTLADVGRDLPAFLRTAGAEPGYLAELAALERAVTEAVYADDRPAFDRAALATIAPDDWPRARFVLDTSVRVLESEWAIDKVWHATDWDADTIGKNISHERQWLLVYRRDDAIWIEDVGHPAAELLRGMAAGQDLETMSEAVPLACGLAPDEGQTIFRRRFGEWTQNGIIREILCH